MSRKRLENEFDKRSLAANLKVCQAIFNRMIRMEAADEFGFCTCVVTQEKIWWQACDAGHFISATRGMTRFDERNVHPQSKASNQFDTSNDSLIKYTIWMVETYGRDVVEHLLRESRIRKDWSKDELIDLRMGWAKRIKYQEKRLVE